MDGSRWGRWAKLDNWGLGRYGEKVEKIQMVLKERVGWGDTQGKRMQVGGATTNRNNCPTSPVLFVDFGEETL